ncbi:MAG: hypothetical protein WA962_09105 [Ornithinimicrobium sp.]
MPDPAAARGRGVRVVLVLCVLGMAVVAGLWTWQRTTSVAQSAGDELPLVVLVSGYAGDGRDLAPIAGALGDQGRRVAVFPPVGDNTGDLREQAALLGEFVDDERGGADSVDVVGYSAGGVVARLWVRDYGGASVARRVLTLAAPQHGTTLARLADTVGLCDGACAQLVPGSELLTRLNSGDETPPGPEWIAMWSERDRTVAPPSTANLAGALAVTVQSICPAATTGHAQLPGSPVVLAALPAVLGADAPTAPVAADVDCDG